MRAKSLKERNEKKLIQIMQKSVDCGADYF